MILKQYIDYAREKELYENIVGGNDEGINTNTKEDNSQIDTG